MHFYVDESGHTGVDLFDSAEPMLYYGVLSSLVNVELLAETRLGKLRERCGVALLRAPELGSQGLVAIIDDLVDIQRQFDLRFDLYRVAKHDHAIISFFDLIFDQGKNPTATRTGYWTTLRYILLLKIASLFDDDLAKKAWDARIDIDDQKAETALIEICRELRSRLGHLPDAGSSQLIVDELSWAENNPGKICFNQKSAADRLQAAPNSIGFQLVMHGIAARIKRHDKPASRIVVDRQAQFNQAQQTLSQFFSVTRAVPLVNGPGLHAIDAGKIPAVPISFSSARDSAGLELADIFMWVFKQVLEKKEIAPELFALIRPQIHRGCTDEISLSAIESRWTRWFEELPEPDEEQITMGKELSSIDEERRLRTARGKA